MIKKRRKAEVIRALPEIESSPEAGFAEKEHTSISHEWAKKQALNHTKQQVFPFFSLYSSLD